VALKPFLLTECEHLGRLNCMRVPGIAEGGVGRIVELAISGRRNAIHGYLAEQVRNFLPVWPLPFRNEMAFLREPRSTSMTGHRVPCSRCSARGAALARPAGSDETDRSFRPYTQHRNYVAAAHPGRCLQ